MPLLLSNASVTGAGTVWAGGTGGFSVVGTFGGATIGLQFLAPDGSTWMDVGTDSNLTAAGVIVFMLPRGQIRAAVTGGAPSGIYASAEHIK